MENFRNIIESIRVDLAKINNLSWDVFKLKNHEIEQLTTAGDEEGFFFEDCIEKIRIAHEITINFVDNTNNLCEAILNILNVIFLTENISNNSNLMNILKDHIKKLHISKNRIPHVINSLEKKEFYTFGAVGSDINTCINDVLENMKRLGKIKPITFGDDIKPKLKRPLTPTAVKLETKKIKPEELVDVYMADIFGQKEEDILNTKIELLVSTFLSDAKKTFEDIRLYLESARNIVHTSPTPTIIGIESLTTVIQDLNKTVDKMVNVHNNIENLTSNISDTQTSKLLETLDNIEKENKQKIKEIATGLKNELDDYISESKSKIEFSEEIFNIEIDTLNEEIRKINERLTFSQPKNIEREFWLLYGGFFNGTEKNAIDILILRFFEDTKQHATFNWTSRHLFVYIIENFSTITNYQPFNITQDDKTNGYISVNINRDDKTTQFDIENPNNQIDSMSD